MSQGRTRLRVVDNGRPQRWEGIVALSEAMLEAARAEHWDRVTELARRRRSEVERFFTTPVAEHEAAWLSEGIRSVLDLDRELLELVEAGREASSAAVVRLHRGRTAQAAYRRCGEGG